MIYNVSMKIQHLLEMSRQYRCCKTPCQGC